MLDEQIIRPLAAGIEQARKTHEMIRPVTAQFPAATIEDAYALQRVPLSAPGWRSGSPKGTGGGPQDRAHVKGNAVAVERQGARLRCLLDDTMFGDGVEIWAGTFTAPRVEV